MEKRLVLLEGAYNVRDLGGYPTKSDKETKWDRFYRGMVFKD
nr:tyrosine-protein phosphatase [endosymbiont 'TC1' of Trimyema compressum]